MTNLYDELSQRGFVQQVSNEAVLRKKLAEEKMTCYIGFDPTADSLHVGNLVQIMMLAFVQRFGHQPIALLGGGTTMVGDPSGRTELRKMLSREQIIANGEKIKQQLGRFLDFENGGAVFCDNADWLLSLNHIDFLRDIGISASIACLLPNLQSPARNRAFLHRIQLSSVAGLRLFDAISPPRLHVANGRQRPMGQHFGRRGLDPAPRFD
jgi:tyrosyl-tRNA synthetase